jgi:hypothetical protein
MPPPNILSHEWGWDNIRRDVFQLVAWGYKRKEKEIRQRRLEEDITGLIRKGINETLDELDDDLLPRFQLYSAHNEDPVDDHGKSGKQRPRVDVLTVSVHQRSDGSAIDLYHVFLDCNP